MQIFECSAFFTRPNDTTAYAANDLVANSTTAGSVVPMTFRIPSGPGVEVYAVRMVKSGATATNASFLLSLFGDSPTVTNGDNGAYAPTQSKPLGDYTLDLTGSVFSDDAAKFNGSAYGMFRTDADRKVYGLLKAVGAYTPAAQEVFTVTLFGKAYA